MILYRVLVVLRELLWHFINTLNSKERMADVSRWRRRGAACRRHRHSLSSHREALVSFGDVY